MMPKLAQMKQLVLKLVIPLTIITFVVFTKWWYTLPIDAPETTMYGFPFPFMGNGWHTSGSTQFFVIEFIIDILVYFSFWFVLVFIFHRFCNIKQVSKILYITLSVISIIFIILIGFWLILTYRENVFYFKRPFDMEIIKSGFIFKFIFL